MGINFRDAFNSPIDFHWHRAFGKFCAETLVNIHVGTHIHFDAFTIRTEDI
jgi:hypothetical protein